MWYYDASFCRYVAGTHCFWNNPFSPWLLNVKLLEKVTNELFTHFFPDWVHFLFVQLTTAITIVVIVVEKEVPFSKKFRPEFSCQFTEKFPPFLDSFTMDHSSGSLIVYSWRVYGRLILLPWHWLRLLMGNVLAISISASVVLLPCGPGSPTSQFAGCKCGKSYRDWVCCWPCEKHHKACRNDGNLCKCNEV